MNGSCNCKAITFKVTGPTFSASSCHCGQCRKQSGNYWASTCVDQSDIQISGPVKWFAASDIAQRGFCPTCGCFLFWKHNAESSLSFSLGAIDGPTGLSIEKHIFVADKGDYYHIADNVPQQAT